MIIYSACSAWIFVSLSNESESVTILKLFVIRYNPVILTTLKSIAVYSNMYVNPTYICTVYDDAYSCMWLILCTSSRTVVSTLRRMPTLTLVRALRPRERGPSVCGLMRR